ncbi:MAG: diguanylate cyclase (GGDEF)-like protein [Chlamydiales bacterium]|jgi:diguanylate cyclase (GGDEF)-like protein
MTTVKPPVKKKVLLIDDDADFCKYVQHTAVSFQNISLEVTGTVEEAKNVAAKSAFDAYIVDGYLPDGSGLDLLQWLDGKAGGKQKFVAFVSSGFQDAKSFRELKETLGVNLLLNKPIAAKDLEYLFSQIIDEKRGLVEDAILDKLQKEYERNIFDKVEMLEELTKTVSEDPNPENLEKLKYELHKIAGSAGSFGYNKATEVCRNLELEIIDRLKGDIPISKSWAKNLTEGFMNSYKKAFQKAEVIGTNILHHEGIKAVKNDKQPDLFLIDTAVPLLQNMKDEGDKRGIQVIVEDDPQFASIWLKDETFSPRLLIVNYNYPGHDLKGFDLIATFNKSRKEHSTTLAMICNKSNVEERLAAMELGIDQFIEMPLTVDKVMDVCELILEPSKEEKLRVLILEDDKGMASLIKHLIVKMGYQASVVNDTKDLFNAINEYCPDLLIMDVHSGNSKSLDILKMIRGNFKSKTLPIMIIADPAKENTIVSAYALGLEGYIAKPISMRILQAKVGNFAKKQSMIEHVRHRDPLTGLVGKSAFSSMFRSISSATKENPTPLTFAILQLENFQELYDSEGFSFFSRVLMRISAQLNQVFRKKDLIAKWDEAEFAVLLENTDVTHAQFLIGQVMDSIQQMILEDEKLIYRMSFQGGFAVYPDHGSNITTLEEAARKALDVARAEGSGRVVPYFLKKARRPKILILENDEIYLGKLIMAFETRGFIVKGYTDIGSIVADFKANKWTILPSLVISDQDVEEKGAAALMEQLPEELAGKVPIILLTEKPVKEELVKAFKSGCTDFLKKPFPIKNLLDRSSTILSKKN